MLRYRLFRHTTPTCTPLNVVQSEASASKPIGAPTSCLALWTRDQQVKWQQAHTNILSLQVTFDTSERSVLIQ